ncbi:MAG: hypothetical protein HOF16_05960 [Campylobacteraceae bacterium]|nr:hypothetical protein [Campylobacteraceae bacterium]
MKYIFGENGCPKYVNLKREYKKCNIEFVERGISRLKKPQEDRDNIDVVAFSILCENGMKSPVVVDDEIDI